MSNDSSERKGVKNKNHHELGKAAPSPLYVLRITKG